MRVSVRAVDVYASIDDARKIIWQPSTEDAHYFYYGVTCHIFGCYKQRGTENYYRFANASCGAYHGTY